MGTAENISQQVGSWLNIGHREQVIALTVCALILVVAIIVVVALLIRRSRKKRAKQAASIATLNKPTEEVVATDSTPEEEVKPTKKLKGKWIIEIKKESEYLAQLLASNGEVMLSSEIYTTEEGAKSGIATIIKGIDSGKFSIYQDKNNNYYYKLKTAGNRLLCAGEIYKSEEQCLKAVETVKRIAKDATIVEELVESDRYVEYKPAPLDMEAVSKGLKGKWKVEEISTGKFCAKLYASNGQLMLATEDFAQKAAAKKAIESVTTNAIAGNFIIDHDKFGRCYYKLRNAKKSVICIGEAYDSVESCVNAIESVRRFAANSTIAKD